MNHAMANTFRQLYLSNEIMESGNFTLMVPGLMDVCITITICFFEKAVCISGGLFLIVS